jgi:hypothetical protein
MVNSFGCTLGADWRRMCGTTVAANSPSYRHSGTRRDEALRWWRTTAVGWDRWGAVLGYLCPGWGETATPDFWSGEHDGFVKLDLKHDREEGIVLTGVAHLVAGKHARVSTCGWRMGTTNRCHDMGIITRAWPTREADPKGPQDSDTRKWVHASARDGQVHVKRPVQQGKRGVRHREG